MTSLSIATNTSQQLFISIKGYLLLMGANDDHELLLYDPGIKSLLKSYAETNKFGKNKLAFSPILENFVSQSHGKSVLSYFNMHTKEAIFKSGTQEKLESLVLAGDLAVGGSVTGTLYFWNVFTGNLLGKLKAASGPIWKLHIDRHQLRLTMLTNEGRVLVYDFDHLKLALFAGNLDMLNLKPLHNISPHKKPVLDMHIPLGQETLCATLGTDDTVKIIDIVSGEILADLFLENDASCFATDWLGFSVFVGFADGRIIKYNWSKDPLVLGIEPHPTNSSLAQPALASQSEKVVFGTTHRGRVSSIAYVPEVQEVFTSGADDMLLAFTAAGVPVLTTGKFKKTFDWMTVIQRPKSFYEGSGFNILSAQKASVSMKPFSKVNEPGTQRILKRHNFSRSRQQPFLGKRESESGGISIGDGEELSAGSLSQKVMEVVCRLSRRAAGSEEKNGVTTGSLEPAIQRRERESAEEEVAELKGKLRRMLELNKQLLSRSGGASN